MPFGHIYAAAGQEAVVGAMDRALGEAGFHRIEMRPELHPGRMKEIDETRMRLFWVSPRLGRWTGIYEFRYYNNEIRTRWGLADESLAARLSRDLATAVYRMEIVENAEFWLWNRFENGTEADGGAYQDAPGSRSTDPAHPRYALNRIIEREGIVNVGLGYEHIPGPNVRPIENVPQSAEGIEGLAGFVHLAYAKT